MLDEGEIEELMALLEKRKRAMERLDGMSHGIPSTTAIKRLRESVDRIEEQLREYNLQIETEWPS